MSTDTLPAHLTLEAGPEYVTQPLSCDDVREFVSLYLSTLQANACLGDDMHKAENMYLELLTMKSPCIRFAAFPVAMYDGYLVMRTRTNFSALYWFVPMFSDMAETPAKNGEYHPDEGMVCMIFAAPGPELDDEHDQLIAALNHKVRHYNEYIAND